MSASKKRHRTAHEPRGIQPVVQLSRRASIADRFNRMAKHCARVLGSPVLFFVNIVLILVWLISGPLFQFSDTWQLVVNTATTVVTYLAVFLIQNTQNRDSESVHLKLDEIIRSLKNARNQFVDVENGTEDQIKKLKEELTETVERNA